eukprot:TRINITY_DN3347_c0_g2_i2.p6 TRINITY_DN3347_c0_g2~~TRINITY_DN3347_c0_g2_i2.p6  ORF type:complete len:100 (-),score=1.84 TRINITY_DN3347_c0_g2_i2:521-820(-)
MSISLSSKKKKKKKIKKKKKKKTKKNGKQLTVCKTFISYFDQSISNIVGAQTISSTRCQSGGSLKYIRTLSQTNFQCLYTVLTQNNAVLILQKVDTQIL